MHLKQIILIKNLKTLIVISQGSFSKNVRKMRKYTCMIRTILKNLVNDSKIVISIDPILWNNLPLELKVIENYDHFKIMLEDHIWSSILEFDEQSNGNTSEYENM